MNAVKAAWRRWRSRYRLFRSARVSGRFQPYAHTEPDRYPWLFRFAAAELKPLGSIDVLSFGCSRGDEVFALRRYLPEARIKGIDIDPGNIAICRARAQQDGVERVSFAQGANVQAEPNGAYDAIFCLAVLCHGNLTTSGAARSDPYFLFADFEAMVSGFARCLKPGGLIFLHTTNFRFTDTAVAGSFEVVFEAERQQLASDAIFDRNNRLIPGERYPPVAFRKRADWP